MGIESTRHRVVRAGQEPLIKKGPDDGQPEKACSPDGHGRLQGRVAPASAAAAAPPREKGFDPGSSLGAARRELGPFHARLWLARLLLAALPEYVGSRTRAGVLRLAGFKIGAGTLMAGVPKISGGKKLHEQLSIGRRCWLNIDCVLDVHADLTIGNRVHLGQEVMILTNTHELGPPGKRSAALHALPVTVENGAWLSARCLILPGVTIGKGAVVAAGAVVTKDVPTNSVVGGVPARIIRQLS